MPLNSFYSGCHDPIDGVMTYFSSTSCLSHDVFFAVATFFRKFRKRMSWQDCHRQIGHDTHYSWITNIALQCFFVKLNIKYRLIHKSMYQKVISQLVQLCWHWGFLFISIYKVSTRSFVFHNNTSFEILTSITFRMAEFDKLTSYTETRLFCKLFWGNLE